MDEYGGDRIVSTLLHNEFCENEGSINDEYSGITWVPLHRILGVTKVVGDLGATINDIWVRHTLIFQQPRAANGIRFDVAPFRLHYQISRDVF